MLHRLLIASGLTLTLTACQMAPAGIEVTMEPMELTPRIMEKTRTVVTYNFKDPDTAKLRDEFGFRLSSGDIAVCGEYNARNSYGAYTGYKPYYVRLRETSVGLEMKAIRVETLATAACDQLFNGPTILVEED